MGPVGFHLHLLLHTCPTCAHSTCPTCTGQVLCVQVGQVLRGGQCKWAHVSKPYGSQEKISVYLGNRKIRSAGRTSGSIEITLPAQLQVLQGVECRLVVRDGTQPEIVLQTDLSAAHTLIRELWQKLRLGLGEIDELGDFSPADFSLALFAPQHWQERPPLAYADALAVLHQRAGRDNRSRTPEAIVRLLAFLSVAAAYRLDLRNPLALAFGDAIAYLITGAPAGLGADFERGMAHRVFWENGRVPQPLGSPFDDQVWQRAKPGFRRVYDQFHTWQNDAESYAAAREQWYRALMVEIGGQASSVAAYLRR